MINYEQITSLVITRKTNKLWVMYVNEAEDPIWSDKYAGDGDGDDITLKTITGAPKVVKVNFNYIEYYDELDSDNNLVNPDSAQQIFSHLQNQEGFFLSGSGGGSSTVENFTDLGDTFANYIGRQNQSVVVRSDGLGLTTAAISTPRLQDLMNYIGGAFLPNKYILTSNTTDIDGNATSFILGDLNSIINRPPAFDEKPVIHKGFTVVDDTVVPNTELYAKEVGDYCRGFAVEEDGVYEYPSMRYDGGDDTDIENYSQKTIKIKRYTF